MSAPAFIGPALYAADMTFLAMPDTTDRRYWRCMAFGSGISLSARYVVDDHGVMVQVSGWQA